jgi:hypothetical protein
MCLGCLSVRQCCKVQTEVVWTAAADSNRSSRRQAEGGYLALIQRKEGAAGSKESKRMDYMQGNSCGLEGRL